MTTHHAHCICIKLSAMCRFRIVSQYTSFIRSIQRRAVKIITYSFNHMTGTASDF